MAVLRALIVEDTPTDAKLIAAALRHGDRTIEFERVDTAAAMRSALERAPWDLITCDWAMPHFSAPAALDLLKASGLDIPFIIVSGTVGEELAADAMRAGAHDYVLKDHLTRLAPAVDRELREVKIRETQRQATAALFASEARYRRIVENTNQGVWVIDPAGTTTFVNARMAQMLGTTASEMLGQPATAFLDDNGRAQLAHAAEQHKAGNPTDQEVRLYRRDNSAVVETLLSSSPMVDAAGRHEGGFAMVMDVTDRKKAEASLRISEARFRSLWESGIILITISDAGGKIIDINEGFSRSSGYSREELLSSDIGWLELTPPEWRQADEDARARLRSGVASAWEKELIAKDGRRVPVMAGAVLLEGSEVISIAIDLTERKRVDRALYERMKIATLNADLGVALTHGDALTPMLQRCAEALARHLEAVVARIWTIDPESNALALQANAGASIPLDRSAKLDLELIVADRQPHLTNDLQNDPRLLDLEWAKREKIVAFAGYPLIVGGDLIGVVTTFARDALSEAALEGLRAVADAIAVGIQRQRAEATKASLEAQLRQAQKLEAIGSLAGGVAHDFNNILSVILGYTEFIKSDLEPGHPILADIQEINSAGVRAAKLTRQLLAFSRQQVLQPRVLNLNEVVRDLKSMLRRLVSEDVELVTTADPTIGNVHADPGQIEQVLMNLVVNARDAMPTGGTVTIETANVVLDAEFVAEHIGATAGSHVMLSVTDTGTGMDAAVRARIFEPFFTTKDQGKGTGLGLSTVFGIVRQSGGSIWVDSELGIGTSFKAYFPTVDASALVDEPSSRVTATRGSETILLCEDEEPVRTLARAILTRNGYRVLEAQNGGEALLLCEQHAAIDLLVTDVVMPMMSGRQLAERLRLIKPTMKVLYMSGYTDDAIMRHGISTEGIAFLQKPITPDALARKVREVLDVEPKKI